MVFAKFIDKNRIIKCPKNGYVGKKAISNLHKYFEKNIEVAKEMGYLKLISENEENTCEGRVMYVLENDVIIERMAEDDN